ncbi:MAG: hypothetical protein QF864_11900, partial [SAR202 cluster bacterium]|nr:hypothetical protein [SAR202 cluster bacterium]
MFWVILLSIMGIGLSSPSYNVELIHHLEEITEYNSNSNFGVSDVWGYTDETGVEYAIVGYRNGTLIYNVSVNSYPILIADIMGPSNG